MIYQPFVDEFEVTADFEKHASEIERLEIHGELEYLVDNFGGKTFKNGMYRVIERSLLDISKKNLEGVFPEYIGRIVPFSYDWLGRHFALDLKRCIGSQSQILMLEIGAGEAMEIPAGIVDFHNIELVDYMNDSLSSDFFQEWRSENDIELKYDECVGYKVPLFLGGQDDISNLERINLDVYIGICGQLRMSIKNK